MRNSLYSMLYEKTYQVSGGWAFKEGRACHPPLVNLLLDPFLVSFQNSSLSIKTRSNIPLKKSITLFRLSIFRLPNKAPPRIGSCSAVKLNRRFVWEKNFNCCPMIPRSPREQRRQHSRLLISLRKQILMKRMKHQEEERRTSCLKLFFFFKLLSPCFRLYSRCSLGFAVASLALCRLDDRSHR